jgi:hypothetical protein
MISRRGSAHWAVPSPPVPAAVDVLVPTADRPAELAVALAGLAAQDDPPFRVVVSDQSHERPAEDVPAVMAMVRVLRAQGREVSVLRHLPRRGLAEQRQFLLDAARAPRVLFLDDDVWLEPGALARLDGALSDERCGFVGFAVQGLSYLPDVRDAEREPFQPWGAGGVRPERLGRDRPAFGRWTLHNAANMAHEAAARGLSDDDRLAYRVAWVGGCVLFDREELLAAGGFGFWRDLPPGHVGEDVLAQWRVMARRGGAGILPSGAVHLEAPTTISDRRIEAAEVVDPLPADPDPLTTEPAPADTGGAPGRTADTTPGGSTRAGEKRGNDERQAEPDPDPEVPGRRRLPRGQGRDPRRRARVGRR